MSFISMDIKGTYRSNSSNISKEFLNKVLEESFEYKRAVGFFSSSSLIDTSRGLANIYNSNGKIKFIVSPRLSDIDIEAIKTGYKTREEIIRSCIERDFVEPKDVFESERLNILAHLISSNVLDIKVAVTCDNSEIGMYHEKIGTMIDKFGNKISFIGSLNESKNAFTNNFESIIVFRSWLEPDRTDEIEMFFDEMWENKTSKINVYDFPKAVKEKILKYRKDTVNWDIDSNEDYTIEPNIFLNFDIPKIKVNLYDYQKSAITQWFRNKCNGIFDMATGTGKTFTALGAMVKLLERKKYKLATIVVCPYQHLVDQWVEDAEIFHIYPIVGYSSQKYSNYTTKLRKAVLDFNDGLLDYFFFITTNASYKSEKVQNILNNLNENVLFVADEAHNLGATKMQEALFDKFKYRLALSATVDRYRDEEGTEFIYDYFGEKCIEYDLKRAIKEGKLTEYKYQPIVVYLSDDEVGEYIKLSVELSKFVMKDSNNNLKLSKAGEYIALKRARLIAGAKNKLLVLKELMNKFKNDYNMLIYCGTAKIIDENNNEEIKQIDKVCKILGEELKLKIGRYTSQETADERKVIKDRFKNGNDLQALVAIKCLDEGVNIPSIKTAFILASSTNPREYVQRRGRVLRLSENKDFSMIYDFITLPMSFDELKYYDENSLKFFQSLVKNEINRMIEFSSCSLNSSIADNLISELNKFYYLNNFETSDFEQIKWRDDYE